MSSRGESDGEGEDDGGTAGGIRRAAVRTRVLFNAATAELFTWLCAGGGLCSLHSQPACVCWFARY